MRTPPQEEHSANDAFAQAETALQGRRINDAINLYRIAEGRGFDADACCGARWVCHMLLGDFAAAWQESERIERHGRPDVNRLWDGKPLRGKRVLIRCLHGLGDTIQYVRYAPLLKKQVKSLTIEVQPPLKRLVGEAGLADHVITWGDAEPAWDTQLEIVELPRIFRATSTTIPAAVPYLKATPRDVFRQNGSELLVGLVWASSMYNPSRCVPLVELRPLFEIEGVKFFSFQAGDNREELESVSFPITDAFDRSGCVQRAANGLAAMDVILTVDTMTAHLAGALGLTVWTMLPFQADWRWMLERSDSPWYPTMRLFRQSADGDWSTPISEVRTQLQASVSEASAQGSRAAGAA